ncbi:MAG: hypothetical protein WCK46_00685 [Candidatus Adlerbacteria bacterium]
MPENKRKLRLAGVVTLIAGVGALGALLSAYGAPRNTTAVADSLRCPSQYSTDAEAAAAFKTFSDDYYANHPNATMGEMLQARIDFYTTHHCTEELQRYKQAAAGEADKATMDTIDAAIQGAQ